MIQIIINIVRKYYFSKKWRRINMHNQTAVGTFFPISSVKIGIKTYGKLNITFFDNKNKSDMIIIGNYVSIAHNTIVHGCTIKDNVLVGMGAIVMDNAIVEENVIIAAGSVVLENSHLESGFVYGGTPAKKIKEIGQDLAKNLLNRISHNYKMYAEWYKNKQ